MKRTLFPLKNGSGFTLIEMLAVLALIGILAAVTIPAMTSVSVSMNVTRAGQLVNDQIALARQTAVARNRPTEVRFVTDPVDPGFSSIQLWEYDASGDNPKAVRRLERLPDAVIIKNEMSPVLMEADAAQSGTANFRALGNRPYKGIRFRANGRVDTSLPMAKTYLTVVGRRDTAAKPANYYTLQISPLTGRVSPLRP